MKQQAWGLLLAAGSGSRMAGACDGPKQFLEWRGEPLYMASARTFARCPVVHGLVFVFPPEELERETARVAALAGGLGLPWSCVAGGAARQDSVRLGLLALPEACDAVLVHDTARPFVTAALLRRVAEGLGASAGVVPALPVTDTIKVVSGERVVQTLNRTELVAVQTPQGFCPKELQKAHDRALAEGWSVTDDASLLERCGAPVSVVTGEPGNTKITNPEDLAMLEKGGHAMEPRVGYGYDVHKIIPADSVHARPLKLGGVTMDGGVAVQAHSDGDVLLHALMDAILGCFGGGDIGQLFPDSDPTFAGVNSAVLLDEVKSRAMAAGLCLRHVDLTIVAQKPKIAPRREEIRANVARLLGLEVESVNVKATTEEGLGFTGEGRGIKAVAVVTALR